MANAYVRTVPKRRRRRHYGVPQLAAQIAAVKVGTVYKVLYGKVQSAKIVDAIALARKRLGIEVMR